MKKKFLAFSSILAAGLIALPMQSFSQDVIKMPSVKETNDSRALERLDEIEGHMRDLTDKIERLEADLNAQKLENQRLSKLIDENNAKNLASFEDLKKDFEKQKAAPIDKIDAVPAPAPIIEPKKVEPTKIITPPPKPVISAAQYLGNAKLKIQSSEFDLAANNLQELLKSYPNATEASEARWLLGEIYFVKKSWLDAAKTYIDYLQKDKNGPRTSDVLVRLASSYRELGDNKQRCAALAAYKNLTKNPSAVLKARADDEIAKAPCP